MLELNNKLKVIGADLTSKLKAVAPVRTGKLRDSLDYLVSDNELSIQVIDYAKYLENRFIEREIDKYDFDITIELIADDLIKNIMDRFDGNN